MFAFEPTRHHYHLPIEPMSQRVGRRVGQWSLLAQELRRTVKEPMIGNVPAASVNAAQEREAPPRG